VREQELLWYQPVVLNHVIQSQKQWEAMVGAYSICFDNAFDEDYVHVAFDMVLVSENADDDVVTTKEHLTPLEEQLGESIQAAQTILKEMRYMEKREARMRMTSESIFTKVSWFSVLSVVILLGVTFVQVRYLKNYFRKKKLM
jgi:p24 family protein delta-1